MQHPLLTAHSFMFGCAVAKWNRKALIWGFCKRAYQPVGPTRMVFVIQLSPRLVVKFCAVKKASNCLVAQIFLFIPGEWCVVHQ